MAEWAKMAERAKTAALFNWSSVRFRSALLAAVVVSITLILGDLLMLGLYSNRLEADLDVELRQQADARAAALDAGQTPQNVSATLAQESMVWIGTSDGTQVAVSGALSPREPVLEADGFTEAGGVGSSGLLTLRVRESYEDDDEEEEEERYRLRFASSAAVDGSLVVVVAAEQERITDAVGSLSQLVAFGLPPLVLLASVFVWFAIGRALRPVEQIRSQAASISGSSLHDRVPVPKSRDEIHELAVTVNEMLDRIEAHDRSLRQFTADASHELKSPVANMRAMVETLNIDDPAWIALQPRLAGEADRLQDLVSNLLYMAIRDAGRPDPEPVELALDDLVFREAEVAAATGKIVIDLSAMQPATVVGVESELYRLIRNVVENGVRHAAERLAIGIELVDAETVCLVVGDDGSGVAVENRERIFERFTRLDSSRARSQGGAGLGLAIVEQIAADHGGRVSVGSSRLGGAEFRIYLPAG